MLFLNKVASWINPLFPLTMPLLANQKLSTQIEHIEQSSENTSYGEKFNGVSIEDANKLHQNVLDYRDSLTDKAKNNVFGITLAVTFIVGMTRIFISIDCPSNLVPLLVLAQLSTLVALFFMIIGGLVSLNTLQGQMIYDFSPDDFTYLNTVEEEKRAQEHVFLTARNMELNFTVNLKINNMITASYSFIRNGLICLLLSTIFVCTLSYIRITSPIPSNPAINYRVSTSLDELKSEQITHNKKVTFLLKENYRTLQNIQNTVER